MKKAIKSTKKSTKKSPVTVANEPVKRGRGRPRKTEVTAAQNINGRPLVLSAAKILKQQIKATKDAQKMYDALKSLSKGKLPGGGEIIYPRSFARDSLAGITRP